MCFFEGGCHFFAFACEPHIFGISHGSDNLNEATDFKQFKKSRSFLSPNFRQLLKFLLGDAFIV